MTIEQIKSELDSEYNGLNEQYEKNGSVYVSGMMEALDDVRRLLDKIPYEILVKESANLYSDIDACISELIKARIDKNEKEEGRALFKMEGLMVGTMQHLAWIMENFRP